MANAVSRVLNAAVGTIIPERRIFIKSPKSTRYLHLSPTGQAGMGLLLLAGTAWGVYATLDTLDRRAELAEARLTRAAIERAWEARHAALEAEHSALAEAYAELERDHRSAAEALGAAQGELVDALAELRAANIERTALKRGVESIQKERALAAERAEELEASLREARLALLEKRGGLQAAPAGEALALAPAAAPALPDHVLSEAMAEVIAERDAAVAKVTTLDAEIAEMGARLERWRERQGLVLAQLEEAVRTGLDGLTGMLERADLDIDRILAETRARYAGQGGPFEPLSDAEAAELEAGEDLRVAALMSELERVNLLRIAVDRLPFGLPVHGARFTSGFGKRRDPFRRRWSMHYGVDYAGPHGTPIETTAEGVVSFSGRMRGYGNVVIIKHSFGYETRYAHLSKKLVRVGERVTRGDRVGLMGSTGRSSGSHLHYEIRIDEDPINPKTFIEAARDVL